MDLVRNSTRRQIQSLVKRRQIAQSYIFLGQIGSFKKQAALYFASALNCKSTKTQPCHNCQVCKNIKRGEALDFFILSPEKSITVADIRNIQNQIKYGPGEHAFYPVIIENAERLTDEASNALLKTLEEPPRGLVFYLLCENLSQILITIQSRSQIFFLPKQNQIDYSTLSEFKSSPFNDQTHPEIIKYYMEKNILFPADLYRSFYSFLKYSYTERITYAQNLSTNKEYAKILLLCWLSDLKTGLTTFNPALLNQCELIIENIMQMKYNLNLRLHLESLFCKL